MKDAIQLVAPDDETEQLLLRLLSQDRLGFFLSGVLTGTFAVVLLDVVMRPFL